MRKRLSSALALTAVTALVGSGIALASPDNDTPPYPSGVCPPKGQALAGVYHPGRLRLLDACASASGAVVRVKHEVDGDVHLVVKPDASSSQLLDQGNVTNAGGNLVVELMPRDAGHLTAPNAGDQIRVVGAWVHDSAHNWNEIHPVWALSINGGAWQLSGPQNGGAPASATHAVAAADCRTASGASCGSY